MPNIEQARSWYPNDNPVHGFDHIIRVYRLAEKIALAEGADLEIVRAAALLHDVGSDQGPNNDARGNHQLHSADFAAQILSEEGWSPERIEAVQHCIRAHRFRDNQEQPQTVEAKILFDADKLDAIGAIGVARAVAYAAMAGQPIYAPPSELFLQKGITENGEPHSAYHEYLFKLHNIKERLYTPTAQRMAVERDKFMTIFFEHLIAEIDAQT